MVEKKTKRWTKDDPSVYYCEACECYHYRYSPKGQKHEKYREKEIEEREK